MAILSLACTQHQQVGSSPGNRNGIHNTSKWAHPPEQKWRERERERVRAAQMQEDQAREREQERRAYEVPSVPSFFQGRGSGFAIPVYLGAGSGSALKSKFRSFRGSKWSRGRPCTITEGVVAQNGVLYHTYD
jgi:hypothetical protein